MKWILSGVPRDESFPPDRLTAEERAELQRLLAGREQVMAQLGALDTRIEVLLARSRDRRGLVGQVRVDLETGVILPAHDPPAEGG